MRSMLSRLTLLAAAIMLPVCALGQTAQPAESVRKLVEGAKSEGKLVIWLTSPAIPRTQTAVMDAFNKRFGLSIQYEWLALHPSRSVPRLVTEASSGRIEADVVGSLTYDDMLVLKEANLLEPYPWVDAFAKDLTNIDEPAGRLIPELRNLGLAFFDNVFLLAWNTNQIKEADLPHKLTDLTDPKWKSRFVTNATYGLPLDTLSLTLGREGALDLARKLLDNQPVLKRGTPAVAEAITSAEAPIGISSFFNSDRAKKVGQPQEYRLLDDYVPVMPLHVVVTRGSAHPNAARLFAAWLVTEGVSIMDQMESGGRVTDPTSAMGQMVEHRAPGAKLVMPHDAADVAGILEARRELNLLFTGR
jgi:iron(III) transport system substrate-binding protein